MYQEEHSFVVNYNNELVEENEIDFEIAPNIVWQAGINIKLTEKINVAPVIYPSIRAWMYENSSNQNEIVFAMEFPISIELYLGNRERTHSLFQ